MIVGLDTRVRGGVIGRGMSASTQPPDDAVRAAAPVAEPHGAPVDETGTSGATVRSAERGSDRMEEFQALLVEILPAAFGYALRLTRNRSDAEDLVQEAALAACRSPGGFELGTNFKAWFFRILTNCFRGRHRYQQRRPQTVDFDDTPDLYVYGRSIANGLPSEGDDPAATLIDRLGTERVTAAIAELPEEFAVVCSLYFMEDFAYQEIADVLEVPVGTVRSRLHRGRKMLQKALWRIAEDAGIIRELSNVEGRS